MKAPEHPKQPEAHRDANMTPDAWMRLQTLDVPVLISDPDHPRRYRLARLIHESSGAQGGPFAMWSCQRDKITDISSSMELLLTLARARGGTVFFDSVSRMAPALQSELFTFLTDESRERRDGTAARPVRIIAGTNVPLLPHVENGSFNAALFYRLNVVHIVVAGAEC
jgi:transcriptional regulator, propionate catabolism operon regulatory protein